MVAIKRGDVWWVNVPPSRGSEIDKRRPAVVISNDMANQYANRVQVVPLTSNVEKIYPCDAEVMVGKKHSKAMADQIMTVDKKLLDKKMASISAKDMHKIEYAIRVQLHLL